MVLGDAMNESVRRSAHKIWDSIFVQQSKKICRRLNTYANNATQKQLVNTVCLSMSQLIRF